MGIWDLKAAQPDSLRVQQVATAAPTTWGENFKEQLDTWITGRNPVFISPLRDRINRSNQYSKITEGRGLYADAIEWRNNNFSRDEAVKIKSNEAVNKYIEHLRQQDPTKWSALETDDEVKRQKIEVAKREQTEADLALAGATRMTQLTTPFVSGMAASFMDPINIATMPIGAAGGASILKIALTEAAVNAATEVAEAPIIAPWQREIGNKYGFSEILQDAGTAAVAGFVFSGAIAGASRMAGLDQASAKLKDMGQPEGADAAKYLSRHEHIQANNLAKAETPEIPVAKHQAAMTEVAEAHANARPIDNSKIPITTDDILNIDTAKIRDPELKATVEKFQANIREDIDLSNRVVKGEDGKPLVVYHGTRERIDKFTAEARGKNTGSPSAKRATFFTDDPEVAGSYITTDFKRGQSPFDAQRSKLNKRLKAVDAKIEALRNTPEGMAEGLEFLNKLSKNDKAPMPKTDYQIEMAKLIAERDGIIGEGGNIIPVYVLSKNTQQIEYGGQAFRDITFNDAIQQARQAGQDLSVFKNAVDDPKGSKVSNIYAVQNTDNIIPYFSEQGQRIRKLYGLGDELSGDDLKAGRSIIDELMRDPTDLEVGVALRTAKELEEFNNTPEAIAREVDEFNALDDNDLIYLGEGDEAVKVSDIKAMFDDEDKLAEAIQFCGLG